MRVSTRALTGIGLSFALVLALAGCGPEPEAEQPAGSSDVSEAKQRAESGESGSEREQEDAESLKSTELPEGFPEALFALPEDAIIDDAGSHEGGTWFVVLRAADQEQADAWWDEVSSRNSLTAHREEADEEGRSAVLSNEELTVDALTIPEDDGGVLLSYDLSEL
ncbi:hypothetical protein J4H92_11790 [Leucobacter weissii]|uniref:Uncharacterized protein n=1 Tax=Leucobacter weissii TaxID=1983706 RepID=A0A939MLU4_9MICO|nr:hypothetical protein [Leucobacter weissii]MBO1902630.1 hypothetical protein [Leucobacter weissii]